MSQRSELPATIAESTNASIRNNIPMYSKTIASLLFLVVPVRFVAGQAPTPSIATPQSNLVLSDFYAHDPFILADPVTKVYYLYTAIGARPSTDSHAGVVAYKSTDLKSWVGPTSSSPYPTICGQIQRTAHGRRRFIVIAENCISSSLSTTSTNFWTNPCPSLTRCMKENQRHITFGVHRSLSPIRPTAPFGWSSYRDGLYMEALAYSVSGNLEGPWRQSAPLAGDDSGHGMLFQSFDNKLMLVLHHPFRQAHAKLYEMRDTGDSIVVDHEWK